MYIGKRLLYLILVDGLFYYGLEAERAMLEVKLGYELFLNFAFPQDYNATILFIGIVVCLFFAFLADSIVGRLPVIFLGIAILILSMVGNTMLLYTQNDPKIDSSQIFVQITIILFFIYMATSSVRNVFHLEQIVIPENFGILRTYIFWMQFIRLIVMFMFYYLLFSLEGSKDIWFLRIHSLVNIGLTIIYVITIIYLLLKKKIVIVQIRKGIWGKCLKVFFFAILPQRNKEERRKFETNAQKMQQSQSGKMAKPIRHRQSINKISQDRTPKKPSSAYRDRISGRRKMHVYYLFYNPQQNETAAGAESDKEKKKGHHHKKKETELVSEEQHVKESDKETRKDLKQGADSKLEVETVPKPKHRAPKTDDKGIAAKSEVGANAAKEDMHKKELKEVKMAKGDKEGKEKKETQPNVAPLNSEQQKKVGQGKKEKIVDKEYPENTLNAKKGVKETKPNLAPLDLEPKKEVVRKKKGDTGNEDDPENLVEHTKSVKETKTSDKLVPLEPEPKKKVQQKKGKTVDEEDPENLGKPIKGVKEIKPIDNLAPLETEPKKVVRKRKGRIIDEGDPQNTSERTSEKRPDYDPRKSFITIPRFTLWPRATSVRRISRWGLSSFSKKKSEVQMDPYYKLKNHWLYRAKDKSTLSLMEETRQCWMIKFIFVTSFTFNVSSYFILTSILVQEQLCRKTASEIINELHISVYYSFFKMILFPCSEFCIVPFFKNKKIFYTDLQIIGFSSFLLLLALVSALFIQKHLEFELPYIPTDYFAQMRVYNTLPIPVTISGGDFGWRILYPFNNILLKSLRGEGNFKITVRLLNVNQTIDETIAVALQARHARSYLVTESGLVPNSNNLDPTIYTPNRDDYNSSYFVVSNTSWEGLIFFTDTLQNATLYHYVPSPGVKTQVPPATYNISFHLDDEGYFFGPYNVEIAEGGLYVLFLYQKNKTTKEAKINVAEGPPPISMAFLLIPMLLLCLAHALATVSFFKFLFVESSPKMRCSIFTFVYVFGLVAIAASNTYRIQSTYSTFSNVILVVLVIQAVGLLSTIYCSSVYEPNQAALKN